MALPKRPLEGNSSLLMAVILLVSARTGAEDGATPEPVAGEEIIVTGERVKRSLKDTPSSVALFGKRDLEQMAAPDRIQDILAAVPNVLLPGRRDTPVIRGQGSAGVLAGLPAFLGGARPRTVMQVDGRTVTFNEFANSSQGLWDVDRVEVFRSPQTTTQGVNSIAGAIFIHTADPSYRLEGHARAIGGDPWRRQLSAAASIPLAADQLALRLSGDVYRGRAADKLSGPIDRVDLNDDRYDVLRAKLLAEPTAVPGLRVLLTVSHVKSQAAQIVGATRPFRARRDDNYRAGYFKVRVDSAVAAITYPLTATLESRTTVAWGDTKFRRFAPQGFGQTQISGRDRSFESIVEWKPEGPIGMIGGVSFLDMNLDQFIDLSATPLGTGSFRDRQSSRGLFGEISWRATPRLTLTGGMRYQSDRKTRTGLLRTPVGLPIDYDKTDHALLPRLSAAYDINERVRMGALVQRAYNPGGVTLDPAHAGEVRFEPEYLWDYEAYARASFLGGSLSLTGNLFYNDMRNAQRTLDFCIPSPNGCVGVSQIANERRGHTFGAELEISYKPSSALTLRSGVGLLGTRITRSIIPGDPIVGKRFAGSPSFTGMAAIEWSPVRGLRLSSQVRHNDGYAGDDAETGLFRIKGSTTVDARASWETGRVTFFGYARNLLDEFVITAWSGPHDDPDAEVGTNDPREIGVGIEARF
jgi:outer membrane receptor protein involved in Fe transport